MKFIINITKGLFNHNNFKVMVNQKIEPHENLSDYLKINFQKSGCYHEFQNEQFIVLVLGDIVIPKGKMFNSIINEFLKNFSVENIRYLKGHFYLFVINKISSELLCFNSLFSILPLYYYELNSKVIISSSINLIRETLQAEFKPNKKFIVEKLVFNYAFLNDTIYNEIKLVPSNHLVKLGAKFEFIKHTKIEDFFSSAPVKWKRALQPISNLFIDSVSNYFPDELFYISLTAGFDGRTLVGAALMKDPNFKTFSYGSKNDKDIIVPQKISESLNRQHRSYIIDDKYAKKDYLNSLEEIIYYSDCNASLSRSYYSYIAKDLSSEVNYFLSGNFGSEIIRTWRIPGVMTSEFLLKSFEIDDENILKQELLNCSSLKYLNQENFKIEIEEVLNQIINYKRNYGKGLSRNQLFYVFFFEQIFRKYFGAEIVVQNHHSLFNRTPFLDFEFIGEILKTELAGVNGRYLERNPFLRFRGQILYSFILKQIGSPLLNFATDRGYKPEDFFSFKGKANIVYNYLNNNFVNKRDKNFTEYNELCFQLNREYFSRLNFTDQDFRKDIILNKNTQLKTPLSQILSIIIYLNKLT